MKPATDTSGAPATNKPAEPKRAISITVSSLKLKPKIFVGAAFFSTGKRLTSMYKKSAPKSSARPAAVQGRSKDGLSRAKSDPSKHRLSDPGLSHLQKRPNEVCVTSSVHKLFLNSLHENGSVLCLQATAPPARSKESQSSTKQSTEVNRFQWSDLFDDVPETPKPPRCFAALYKI